MGLAGGVASATAEASLWPRRSDTWSSTRPSRSRRRVGLVAVLVILVVLGASIPAIRYLLRLNAAEVLHGR